MPQTKAWSTAALVTSGTRERSRQQAAGRRAPDAGLQA
jgi:hypothetical protein